MAPCLKISNYYDTIRGMVLSVTFVSLSVIFITEPLLDYLVWNPKVCLGARATKKTPDIYGV